MFEALDWVKAGKPLDPPPWPPKKQRRDSPLEYAIDYANYDMVKVLLVGGADVEHNERYCALAHAVGAHRLDMVKLMVEHGADIAWVDMREVFGTYESGLMDYFIEQGADVQTGNPLAYAFCHKIYPALGFYKRHKDRFPNLKEQANIALRHHCNKWNMKWVSLMLWLGADPYARGVSEPGDSEDIDAPNDPWCAIDYALGSGHPEIFDIKRVGYRPQHPDAFKVLKFASEHGDVVAVDKLLSHGYQPNDRPDGTSSLISGELMRPISHWQWLDLKNFKGEHRFNWDESVEKLKVLTLLLKSGARWRPGERAEINSMRRSLKESPPDFSAEFVWLLVKYQAAECGVVEELFKPDGFRIHVREHLGRIIDLIERLPDVLPQRCGPITKR